VTTFLFIYLISKVYIVLMVLIHTVLIATIQSLVTIGLLVIRLTVIIRRFFFLFFRRCIIIFLLIFFFFFILVLCILHFLFA
jgi:hypothetical protein